tara:strand:- start:155 stop:910 length:756 start_codon:yes stop_codon:yes gene_type:complete
VSVFKSFAAIMQFDIRLIARDQLLLLIVIMIAVIVAALTLAGHYRAGLGLEGFGQWLPYFLILAVISNPASYGMVFGLLLVEEVETRVRSALLITPVGPVWFVLMRTPLLVVMLTLIGFGMGYGIGTAWGFDALSGVQWLAISAVTAMIGPAIMILMSTFASNRVEALAMGKLFSAITTPPVLLYLLPDDAWYRVAFLIFPTTPVLHAFEAFRQGADVSGYQWLIWAILYAIGLTALAVRRYLAKSYGVVA